MAQWPTTPIPQSMRMRSVTPTLVSVSQSLKRQVRTRGGQRWGIALSYRSRTPAHLALLWAFMQSLRGQFNTCTFVLPAGARDNQGTWPGSPVSDGINAAGTHAPNLRGLTAGQTGIAKAGDLIKWANDPKVYMVTADANSDGAGKATLAIEPALMLATADGDVLTKASVPFTMALAQDDAEFAINPPSFNDLDVSLVEAV